MVFALAPPAPYPWYDEQALGGAPERKKTLSADARHICDPPVWSTGFGRVWSDEGTGNHHPQKIVRRKSLRPQNQVGGKKGGGVEGNGNRTSSQKMQPARF
jgi:hypothetical protein